jgi:exonuclease VII large subunit
MGSDQFTRVNVKQVNFRISKQAGQEVTLQSIVNAYGKRCDFTIWINEMAFDDATKLDL